MGAPQKTLIGNNLVLGPIDVKRDAPEWFDAMQDPDMHRWTGNTRPQSLAEVQDVVLATYANHPDIMAWAIHQLATERLVGLYWIGVPFIIENQRVTFDAQRIARPYWRTGVTQEARGLVYRHVFLDLGVAVIRAAAWEENLNSCRSMEYAGFELFERRARFNSKYDCTMIEREYVLTRARWEQFGWRRSCPGS